MTPGLVDEFDADRLVIEAGLARPVACASVPGAPRFGYQLVGLNTGLAVGSVAGLGNQVVRADRIGGGLGQYAERILEVGCRVMDDDDADTTVEIGRFGSTDTSTAADQQK